MSEHVWGLALGLTGEVGMRWVLETRALGVGPGSRTKKSWCVRDESLGWLVG